MQPISREDVERFAEGNIASPQDASRIEHAIEHDPQVTQWFEEAQAGLAPSPAAQEALNSEVQRLFRSFYSNLRWHAPIGVNWEHGQVREATAELPSGEQADVVIRTSEGLLTIECKALPPKVQPASIALFSPRETELALFERPAPAKAEDDLLEPASQPPKRLAADGAQQLAAETPLVMACDSGSSETWATTPICSHGGEIWAVDTHVGHVGVAVRCKFPQDAAPAGVRFRFAWEDVESGRAHQREEAVRLGMPKDGFRSGEGPLRVDLRRFQRAQRAGKLDLAVLLAETPPASLDAAALREIVGDDFQTLILDPVESASTPTFQAQFRNDEQRRLWADPAACRMLRFEPL
jgi:hypothetical protein